MELKGSSDDPKVYARIGYAIIFFCFFVLGGWAAVTPLGSAVVAPGIVTTEGNKKTIQHLEGGIVREILVHEGEHVNEGEVILRLDDTAPKANLEIYLNQLYAALAREGRLVAELAGNEDIQFSSELTSASRNAIASTAMDDQRAQFKERRATIEAQVSILRSRADQLRQEIEGLNRQQAANEQQVGFIDDELQGVRHLYEKSLVSKSRMLSLERERSRLEGEIGRAISDRAKAEKGIGETQLQIEQIKQKFLEEAGRDLVDTREKLRDLRNKYVVAEDTMRRVDIRAPITGRVQNLRVFTIGAVVRQGEPLLDIAPDEDKLVIDAHVPTNSIEGVFAGKTAEVRFAAFHDRALPMIGGTIMTVSQDRMIDESSKESYYLARIYVPQENIPEPYREQVTPGMSVEIIMPTRERTALDYLIEPLFNRMRISFREK